MTVDPAGAWAAVTTSPLFGLGLTLGAYQAARALFRRLGGSPLVTPVLVAVVVTAGALALLGVDQADYLHGASYLTVLLGPATVALALPLHRQAERVRSGAVPLVAALLLGSAVAVTGAVVLTRATGGSRVLALSLAPKSATTPVSIAVSQHVGGIVALTAGATVLAGILGAVAGPRLLDLVGVRDPRARGFAVGVASHGIGTSRMLQEGPVEGGFGSLGMAVNAVVTAVLVPLLAPALLAVVGQLR